jgi:hypothetical protein
MKFTVLALAVIVLMIGCTKIDYVGDEYPPTSHVDLFFDEDDVERDYKVMGHLVATADDYVSTEKMQEKILEEAQKKGADGVIILNLERYQAGESTTYKETTDTKETKKGTQSTTTATTSTKVDEKKEIKATFIKYE